MIGGFVSRKIVVVAAVAGMVVGAISDFAVGVPLKDGDRINGYIRSNSPGFQFRNTARAGTPTQTARGEEHTFTAQRGDVIEISVDPEDGSTLRPLLVLFDPTGRQVAYNENPSFFQHRVVRPGTYRLLVLGRNNTAGRYALEIDGISGAAAPLAQADQVMQNVLRLRVIGCGIPGVAKIRIGAEERCTRDIETGTYTYDEVSRSIKLVDTRRDLLARELQLTMLERCPSPPISVVQIALTDPQDNREYVYCATPNRYVRAGAYRYNPVTDTLTPITAGQLPTQPTQPTQPTDARRQILQNEYGLVVLDNCPAARSSYVVVNFPENNQIYQYCANPNRFVAAGEYNYNLTTRNLDRVTKPTECTVSIGGVCLVK